MSLKHRIGKLEEAAGSERCDNCREWSELFIVFEKHGMDPPDGLPEDCPGCGYEPLVIIVRRTKEAGKL